ncbi:MAG: hypothetical protein Hals2KO_26350 [Halioglobus sp.]
MDGRQSKFKSKGAGNIEEAAAKLHAVTEPRITRIRKETEKWLEHRTFMPQQEKELREAAIQIVKNANLGALPWDDAWNGAYPLRPNSKEVDQAVDELKLLYLEILESQEVVDRNWEFRFFIETCESLTFPLKLFHK